MSTFERKKGTSSRCFSRGRIRPGVSLRGEKWQFLNLATHSVGARRSTNVLLIIRDRFGLSFASKGVGYLAALLLLLSLLARYKLSCYQTTPLLTISALVDITLLKTTCHFLLLLIRFDTLTYQKEIQLIPYTCGSSPPLMTRPLLFYYD